MALPKLNTPTYELVLPSTGEKIKYRPFLVKEQKLLMIAKESEKYEDIANAVGNLVHSCTFGEINAETSAMFDIEYIFMKVRSKSIGETQKITLTCVVEDCDGQRHGVLDMSDIEVDSSERDDNSVIELSDELSVELQIPSATKMVNLTDLPEDKLLNAIMLLSMTKIYDKENIYDLNDYRDSEIQEFIDSMSVEQFNIVSRFFASVPSVALKLETVCEKCKDKQTDKVKGFANFF